MNLEVLYPGAMKPFHDGHLSLLSSYLLNNDRIIPSVIHLIISPSKRSGITADTTYQFINKLDFSKINKESELKIQIANCNPIVACYSICGHSDNPDTKFVLAASDKGDDAKRVNDFKKSFSAGSKYYDETNPNKVIDLDVDIKPIVYSNRTDKFNGRPVSATVIRYDVHNNDYKSFKTSYEKMLKNGIVKEDDLYAYFQDLKNELEWSKSDTDKLDKLLHENAQDKLYIKTNKIYQMRRKLNELYTPGNTIKLNITKMAHDLKNTDFNAIRDELTMMGARVDGQIGNGTVNESASTRSNVYMLIKGLSRNEVFEAVQNNVAKQEGKKIVARNYEERVVKNRSNLDNLSYPTYESVVIDDDYPSFDECDTFEDCVDCDEEYDNELEEYVSKKRRHVLEKRKSCCPPKKRNRMVSLSEALKAADTKKQDALSASEKKVINTIEDIVNAAKGNYITTDTAKSALDKLKKENKVLGRIAKNDEGDTFKVSDVKGASKAITTLKKNVKDAKVAGQIDAFQKSLKESVLTALKENRGYLHGNVKVNGKAIKEYTIEDIKKLIKEAKNYKATYIEKLKNSLNESVDENTKAKIAKISKLLSILDEELTYRVTRQDCLRMINEDDNGFSDEDLANMFGAPQGEESAEDTEADSSDAEEAEDTEEVELARIVITLQNKAAAEELMQSCIDAGIPEDAMEIEDGTEDESSDAEEAESSDAEEAESDDAFSFGDSNESVKYNNIAKLFEDDEDAGFDFGTEEPADESSDAEDSEEQAEGDDEPVKFVLTNTDYVHKLSNVLDDVYGISKEELEEMIGGEIVNEEPADESSDAEEVEDDDMGEDELDPSDIFKGL